MACTIEVLLSNRPSMTMPTKITPKELLQKLKRYVQEGDDRMDQCMEVLKQLKKSVKNDKFEIAHHQEKSENHNYYFQKRLEDFRESNETLLHLAAKYQTNTKFMKEIIKWCPNLLLVSRQKEYEGQLPLHIAITKKNKLAIQLFLEQKNLIEKMLNVQATGCHFINTVMMGELPLSTAALTLEPEILSLMLNTDEISFKVSSQNSYGDNIIHSLVKYSCLQPEKSDEIIAVFKMINETLTKNPSHKVNLDSFIYLDQKDQMAVWFQPNLAQKTPLQLAASLNGVPKAIFYFILELDGIYSYLDGHDGLFDVHRYDITEIDPVALRKFTEHKKENLGKNKVDPQKDVKDLEVNDTKTRFIRFGSKHMRKSVLEASCEVNMEQALGILNLKVIKVIIEKKWKRYRWIYFIWAALHLIYMGLLTWSAIVKAEWRSSNRTITSTTDSTIPVLPNVMTGFNMLISLIIIVLELRRKFYNEIPLQIRRLHHNGTYRLMLLVFSGSLMIDGIWHIISISTSAFPGNDYFLILALLIGFWFFTFFLRAFQKFSFFTVMLQEMLVGDAFRFTVIILLEYISFTVIMYMVFLSTRPEGFESIGNTFLTMFNLMLGLTELGVLTQASEPWLAAVLFICFIVLTYVLMFNALIAMMSNTCNYVSQNRFIQGKLQKLSVILFLEELLPLKFKLCCGESKEIKRYDFQGQKMVKEERYFLEIDSLQDSAEGFDDLRQENKSRRLPQFYILKTAPKESRTSDEQKTPVTLRQEPTLQPDISTVK